MVLTYLRLHWLMILFCGTLLGQRAGVRRLDLAPEQVRVVRPAPGRLRPVVASPTRTTRHRNRTEFATYVKTQAQLIKCEFVLSSALGDERYRIADLPTLKEQKDPIKYLDEKLVVGYSEGNEVVRITLEGDRPDDIAKIVNAVKDAYFREVVEKEMKAKKQLLDKVEKAKLELDGLMEKKVGVPGLKDTPPAVATAPMAPGGGVITIPTLPGVAPGQEIVPAGGVPPVGPAGAAVAESERQADDVPGLIQPVARLENEIKTATRSTIKRQTETSTRSRSRSTR